MIRFAICPYTKDGTVKTEETRWLEASDIQEALREVRRPSHDLAGMLFHEDVKSFVTVDDAHRFTRADYDRDPYTYGVFYCWIEWRSGYQFSL